MALWSQIAPIFQAFMLVFVLGVIPTALILIRHFTGMGGP